MTNFERMKPGLDILFDDIQVEEFVNMIEPNIECSFCKIRDKCWELMRIDELNTLSDLDIAIRLEDGPTCSDIMLLYLNDTGDENWVAKNPG